MSHAAKEFIPLNIAVLTVSDTRTEETDTSGKALIEMLEAAGHKAAAKRVCKDDRDTVRAAVAEWIADDSIHVVLTTGGTGFSSRDCTPEAVQFLFDKQVEGFGELFRHISYEEIGTSTIQSRAIAGLCGKTLVFCLPGSTGACRTGWNKIVQEQLDSRHKPCNFVALLTGS